MHTSCHNMINWLVIPDFVVKTDFGFTQNLKVTTEVYEYTDMSWKRNQLHSDFYTYPEKL